MIPIDYSPAFNRAANKLARAATRTVEDYSSGELPDEPTFTGALVTRLKDSLDGTRTTGISWSAKVMSSHGPNTEETEFGADFLGVLSLDLPDLQVKKGFLAQAKRQEPGAKLSRREWDRLFEQCKKMTSFTAQSFVFVYSHRGVFAVSATVLLLFPDVTDLHQLGGSTLGNFYKHHFRCVIGDQRIDSTNSVTLARLRYRAGLELNGEKARPAENPERVG